MLRSPLLLLALSPLACAASQQAVKSDGAVTSPNEWKEFPGGGSPAGAAAVAAGSRGERIAQAADELVGLKSLSEVTNAFPDDCTGLVRIAYARAGIDLLWGAARGDNGVTAIYRTAWQQGAVHGHRPLPGDLVFFKNTWDRNHDGRVDDGLTHVGVVEAVDEDGTVTFVHRNGRGVTREKFNLARPRQRSDAQGAVINDYLRSPSRNLRAFFAAELFAGYASSNLLR